MDNISIARILDETATLLEIDAADPFRVRSYRRAAEAVEQQTTQLASLASDPKQLLAIGGIGKGMSANILDILNTGSTPLRDDLLKKYRPSMLELLRLPGMGPKTVAVIWSSLNVCDIDALEEAAKAGALNKLPAWEKSSPVNSSKELRITEKIPAVFASIRLASTPSASPISSVNFPASTRSLPAGSLRRGRETVGDLDLLVTGPACEPDVVAAAVEHVASLPSSTSSSLAVRTKSASLSRNNLQVDVRLLPRSSARSSLAVLHRLEDAQRRVAPARHQARHDPQRVRSASRRRQLHRRRRHRGASSIAPSNSTTSCPSSAKNSGELEAAANHTLPQLITATDIRGDLHMHTVETDGSNTIREMAQAALDRGLKYIAITDHSKNLAMTNGMDDVRALAHIQRIREIDTEMRGSIRVLAGVEVDILAEGELDPLQRNPRTDGYRHRQRS